MRTTIELPNRQRSRLLALSAERGERGFSRIVQEALDRYFDESAARAERVREALRMAGAMPKREADILREHVRGLRYGWR